VIGTGNLGNVARAPFQLLFRQPGECGGRWVFAACCLMASAMVVAVSAHKVACIFAGVMSDAPVRSISQWILK